MSFETVVAISAVTEVVVLLAIVLTLANAFSDGYLAALVTRPKVSPPAKHSSSTGREANTAAQFREDDEATMRRAA